MRKAPLLVSFLFVAFLSAKAQFKLIAEGASFDEPRSESVRLILMKNGTLVFLQAESGLVKIRMYNTDHKETVSTSVEPVFANGKDEFLIEAFELNSDISLFITKVDSKVPYLYRLVIDGTTGKLKSETKIVELKKLTTQKSYALYFSREERQFFISKDPNSDNYAVAFCNSFRTDKSKKIEIVQYGSDHQEISHASYENTNREYEYFEFAGITVIGSERVYLSIIAENNKVILLGLKKGGAVLTSDVIDLPKDESIANGYVSFNQYTNEVIIITILYKVENKNLYIHPGIVFIDPGNGKTKRIVRSDYSKAIYQKGSDIYGKKYTYSGNPVNIYYNDKGGFTVAYEEELSTLLFPLNSFTRAHIGTYDLVFADYTETGDLISNYFIPKNYWLYPYSTKENSTGGFGNQYKRFAYIKSGTKKYVLLNDTRKNIERLQQGGEPIQIMSIGNSDAFYFTLIGENPIPDRRYLYSKSGDEEPNSPSPFGIAIYDNKNDLLITLRLKKEEKNKSVSIIWLKPE